MHLTQHFREIMDLFAYVFLYAPDFPDEDQTSLEKELSNLAKGIKQSIEKTRSSRSKHWLGLSLTEFEKSRKQFQSRNCTEGRALLQSSSEYYDNARKKKNIEVSFIVNSGGDASLQ